MNVISYLFDPQYLVYKCSTYSMNITIGYANEFIDSENSNFKRTFKKYIKRCIFSSIIRDKNDVLLQHFSDIGKYIENMIDYWILCQNGYSLLNLDNDIIKNELQKYYYVFQRYYYSNNVECIMYDNFMLEELKNIHS